MSATFVEPNDDLEPQDFESVEGAENTETPPQEDNAPKLPEKYRNKSLEEIIAMHQEAEKLIGRQAQEVGEVRKLADELIKRQFNTEPVKQEPQATELDDIDFFVDPKKAVEKVIANHPTVRQAETTVAQMRAREAQQVLAAKHPDAKDIVTDPDFAEWVQGSKVRMQLFQAADQQFDLDAADELLSTYKLYRGQKAAVVTEGAVALQQENRKALKDASVPSSQSSGATGKKFYRRADLIRLQMTDPDRYMALQDEIMQAYQEGRVK